ncbi:MAG TPA: hypothetical protein ENJ01_06680 [Gammaproteobacteria bacterium]|nr:hypothetical protein [Gammaproteobacteria bacterium]
MRPASQFVYPAPADVGLRIPPNLIARRFEEGFQHALAGGQIRSADQLRLSFREGYRAGKLYLKALRRRQGIVEFPLMGKLSFRARLH